MPAAMASCARALCGVQVCVSTQPILLQPCGLESYDVYSNDALKSGLGGFLNPLFIRVLRNIVLMLRYKHVSPPQAGGLPNGSQRVCSPAALRAVSLRDYVMWCGHVMVGYGKGCAVSTFPDLSVPMILFKCGFGSPGIGSPGGQTRTE